jgi:hypothetical protein
MVWMMVAGIARVGPDGRWRLKKREDRDVEWRWRWAWGGGGGVVLIDREEW